MLNVCTLDVLHVGMVPNGVNELVVAVSIGLTT